MKIIAHLSPKSITISIVITLIQTGKSLFGVLIPAIIISMVEQQVGWWGVVCIIVGYCGITLLMDITKEPLNLISTAYEYTMNNLGTLKIGQKGMRVDYAAWESSKEIDKKNKAVMGSWEFMGIGTVIFENLLGAILSFLTMVYIIIQVDVWVLGILLILMFMNLYLEKYNAKVQYNLDQRLAQYMKQSKYDTELLHNLELGKEIRLYQAEDFVCNKYSQSYNKLAEFKKEKFKATLKIKLIMYGVTFIQSLSVYLVAVWKYSIESISIGYFMLFYNSIIMLANSVETIFTAVIDIQHATIYYGDYEAYMNMRETGDTGLKLGIEPREVTHIVLNNVSFKYPTNDTYTLKNVSMELRSGTKVAFVGENGSGKTTLIKLLMRLYDVTEGEILLNGKNIQDYDYEAYLKLIAPVFQDFVLHAYSIKDNIVFGDSVNEEEVWKLIREVGLQEVVEKAPEGLDTFVTKEISERGVDFSGGEKQKLAIARAFFKGATFSILDEPTSALDPMAEKALFELFDRFVRDKTGIYISHRMPSVKMADEIFVLEQGSIIEHGSLQQLLALKGKFATFYEMQKSFYQ